MLRKLTALYRRLGAFCDRADALALRMLRAGAWVAILLAATGCNSLIHDRDRIDNTHGYPKAECEGWLGEAERRLGLGYQGEGIDIYPNVGVKQVATGEWTDANGHGATTTVSSKRQVVRLFVDPVTRRETAEEGIHEMAHCVLLSRGISGHPARYAHLFLNWSDGRCTPARSQAWSWK